MIIVDTIFALGLLDGVATPLLARRAWASDVIGAGMTKAPGVATAVGTAEALLPVAGVIVALEVASLVLTGLLKRVLNRGGSESMTMAASSQSVTSLSAMGTSASVSASGQVTARLGGSAVAVAGRFVARAGA